MARIDNNVFTQPNPTANSPRNNPSLATQLTNLNNEVTAIENTVIDGYVQEYASVTYLTTKTFTVVGDKTGYYTGGRLLQFANNANPTVYTTGTVISSSYNAGTGLTTVTMYEATVPSPIGAVYLSLQPKGATERTQIAPTIINPTTAGTVQKVTQDGDGVTIALDFDGVTGSSVHEVTLGDGSTPNPINRTLTFNNLPIGKFVTVDLIQDAIGGRTVTWPTIIWTDGILPVLTTTANRRDSFAFKKNANNTISGYQTGANMY